MAGILTKHGFVHIHEFGPRPFPEGADVWWRAEDKRYANYDPWAEFERPSGSHLQMNLTPYVVDRHTPKGVWLRGSLGARFFVRGNAIRQHAVPTRALAIRDLIARKKVHVRCAASRLAEAEEHLHAAEQWLRLEGDD